MLFTSLVTFCSSLTLSVIFVDALSISLTMPRRFSLIPLAALNMIPTSSFLFARWSVPVLLKSSSAVCSMTPVSCSSGFTIIAATKYAKTLQAISKATEMMIARFLALLTGAMMSS